MPFSILEVKNLVKYFKSKDVIKAVDDVSFSLKKGEILGLVGESGSGKSTLIRTIAKLYNANSGNVIFNGIDLMKADQKTLLRERKNIQIIFQDPYSSLDERMNIGSIIAEPIKVYNKKRLLDKKLNKGEIEEIVKELLKLVGLDESYYSSYPATLSGGQRQRVAIARSIALKPKVILADEILSSLDKTLENQILNLLLSLRDEMDLSIIFISHDLDVVKRISDRILFMYKGKIVEELKKGELQRARHPYTKKLLECLELD